MNCLPTNCPCCNSTLVWAGVDLKCTNNACGDSLVKSLASFLIKAGVEGVTATSLENWNIFTIEEMLNWTANPEYKSELKFAKEIKEKIFSKTTEELFSCMTFNGAGETNINKLLDFYGEGNLVTTTNVLYNNADKLFFDMKGYPEKIGQKVIDKIKDDWRENIYKVRSIIADPRWKPIIKAKPVVNTNSSISGKSFCITGTLSKGRKEFEKMVTDNGGTLSSVSKKLDFLIAGADAGSKLDKASSLGVTVLTEDQFVGMI